MRKTFLTSVSITVVLLCNLMTSFGVPITADLALSKVVVDKPLSGSGYSFTSHAGQQEIFEDFSLTEEAEINRITWYGLFSEDSVASNQSTGSFDVFVFSSDSDDDYLKKIPLPEGAKVDGLPAGEAIFAMMSTGATGIGTGQGDELHGGDIKRWTIDIPTLSLAADEYFISIRARSSESGFFLWSHSTAGVDGYTIHGLTSPTYFPEFGVSAEHYDTQAFSLEWVPPSSHNVPDGAPGIAALLALLCLLIFSRCSPSPVGFTSDY